MIWNHVWMQFILLWHRWAWYFLCRWRIFNVKRLTPYSTNYRTFLTHVRVLKFYTLHFFKFVLHLKLYCWVALKIETQNNVWVEVIRKKYKQKCKKKPHSFLSWIRFERKYFDFMCDFAGTWFHSFPFKRVFFVFKDETQVSFQFLARANTLSESIMNIYMKYMMGGFAINAIVGCVVSMIYCWIIHGNFDTNYLFLPYKLE